MRTTGAVYRDEAAELVAAAARGAAMPPPADTRPPQRRKTAPNVTPEARNTLPYPEPIGVNDNLDGVAAPAPYYRRRLSIPRLIARIVIAPLYAGVALAAAAVIALFARGLIGL